VRQWWSVRRQPSVVADLLRFVILGLCAFASACGRTPAVRRQPGLNVLLITIDTLRADALGVTGNARASTPMLDGLANAGVRFAAAYAHNVITLPSHANILSGLYPNHHGVHENSGFRFPRELDTLATRLKAAGYRTGAFVSAFPLDRRFGLDRGFDLYDDKYGKGHERSAFRVAERPGTETVAAARAWIDAPDRGGPWFAWVHLYEPHFPYAPPEPFAARFATDPYLGEVAAADAALQPLIEPIVAAGIASRTLIVVTGDHGEALGEHGETTHGLFAYEATLRVPLLMFAPQLFGRGGRIVAAPVRHVDIMPTVLDAVDAVRPNDSMDGRSVLALADGGELPPVASYFESLSATLNRGWAPLYGVMRGSLKYIDLPMTELYDLSTDPREERNLTASRPADINELQRVLQSARAAERASTRTAETAETRERLRSLGYISGTAAVKTQFTVADDPKRLIAIDRAIENVVSRYQSGDLKGAIAAAQQVQRERPDMPIALVHLAFLYNQAGDHSRAADTILRALALNPSADETAALAGAYLTEAGRAREAVERLAGYAASETPDVDVLIAYGVALAESGRPRDAMAAFDRARAVDSSNGLASANIGTIYLQSGDLMRAETAFKEALQVDPTVARAENGLGVIAANRGDNSAAITHWQRAVSLDPHDYQTLFNLGDLLRRLGRPTEARPYLEQYLREAPPDREAVDIARVRNWIERPASRH
jgi:arylsulfatase A-like enzyme/Tfp pilus assembly protein PilF